MLPVEATSALPAVLLVIVPRSVILSFSDDDDDLPLTNAHT